MQLRFFPFAVMTIGTMAQLVWAASISVPAVQALFPGPAGVWGQKSLIHGFAHEVPTLREAAAVGKYIPRPKPDLNSVPSPAPLSIEPGLESIKPILARAESATEVPCDCAPPNSSPNLIDLYVGPHIIIICSELTRPQKLQMGCR
jgi:hypothetical protein